jgi:hypothetical protein
MCNVCTQNINAVFQNLAVGQEFRTPDNQKPANFTISTIDQNSVIILPQSNGLAIRREAFEAALHYLVENNHIISHVCEIRSNNSRGDAGPLCRATRDQNSNIRCINYILPILAHNNLVGINGARRPNTTWLI